MHMIRRGIRGQTGCFKEPEVWPHKRIAVFRAERLLGELQKGLTRSPREEEQGLQDTQSFLQTEAQQ